MTGKRTKVKKHRRQMVKDEDFIPNQEQLDILFNWTTEINQLVELACSCEHPLKDGAK